MSTTLLSFETLLEDARVEALAVLRELLFPDPQAPAAHLRERRMAAIAILRIDPSAGCHAQRAERVGRVGAEHSHSQSLSPSVEGQATTPNSDSAEHANELTPAPSRHSERTAPPAPHDRHVSQMNPHNRPNHHPPRPP